MKSEEEGSLLKSQWKCENKISGQSCHIRDLWGKLHSAVAENSQMWEFLYPSMLQTLVTNALQAAQAGSHGHANNNLGSKQAFLG